ncbi:hypothetical protein C7445_10382 [Alicyclobacillus sacchari]|uniref:Uncharacterized protein n=1 Tax=Alicyclobacillus sacchari TaxID=392010 RepID=A0A4R8LR42_9BACL|nr:hypothetical protein C7445_10382 [Alicyclobacillus sacchari]
MYEWRQVSHDMAWHVIGAERIGWDALKVIGLLVLSKNAMGDAQSDLPAKKLCI